MAFMKTFSAFLALLPISGVLASMRIHPGGDKDSCLGVYNPNEITSVTVFSCTSFGGAKVDWDIAAGDNPSVRLTGTEFCLNAGANSTNGTPSRVYPCQPGASQQRWYLTGDDRIAVTGGNQCLDRKSGTNDIQTWQCSSGNTNQVFSTTDSPPADTVCVQGQQRIAFPPEGADLTALVRASGRAATFRFQYCSEHWFRQSSNKIAVVLTSETDDGVSGSVLAEQVANNGATYNLNLTLTAAGPIAPTSGKYILEVLEFWSGSYNPSAVTRTTINVVI